MSRSGSSRSNRLSSGRAGTGNASTGSGTGHVHDGRLSSTSSSPSNNSLMAPDTPALQVPALALTLDATHAHISRAASFRAPKASNELHVEEGAMHQVRRNSMPNVNNLLNVPGTSSSSATGASDASEVRDARIRRVRSFKTTSKGVVVNRGDSFKKKSTHSLMSTGSTVTDADSRARGNSGNNNSPLATGPAAPAYFRVNMMGAAGVGKTSLAQQFLTSEYIGHDDSVLSVHD
nr:hypothetical protein BaRGS_012033 [Batillaria attramentaria]